MPRVGRLMGNTATRYIREYCYKVLYGILLQGIMGNTASRYIREYCYKVLWRILLQGILGNTATRYYIGNTAAGY